MCGGLVDGSCGPPSRLHHVRDHRAARRRARSSASGTSGRSTSSTRPWRSRGSIRTRTVSTTARSWPSSPRSTSRASRTSATSRFPVLAGKEIAIGEARDYWLEHKDGAPVAPLHAAVRQPSAVGSQGPDHLGLRSHLLHRLRPRQDQSGRGSAKARPRGARPRSRPPPQKPGENAALDALQTQLGAYAAGLAKTIAVECSGP